LHTLPSQEWTNGFAELLKHALISDVQLWQDLSKIQNVQKELQLETIQQGVQIKAQIVAQDPTELGLRKILNFGHTIGHALESYYLNTETPLSHGHAVALGLLLESKISVELAALTKGEFLSIEARIKNTYALQVPNDAEGLWALMQQDKKNDNGEVRICLLPKIGSCLFDQKLAFEDFQKVLANYSA
jgi:3-dehydroquinate synthase